MATSTKEILKTMLKNNVDGKYNVDIYVFEADELTEDFVRENKDYIDFDELFERRYCNHSNSYFSKDFLSEFVNEKNFGEWMSKESGIKRYVRTGEVTVLRSDLIEAFKGEILNYARTLDEDDFNDYEDFYDRCYDDELKEWLKKEQDKYYWKDGVQYYKDED